MSWERALEADARIAAKNSVLIRAALRQSIDFEAAFRGYQATNPDTTLSLPQQRVRARSWAIINIRVNLEAFKEIIYKLWAQAYVLGDLAAGEVLREAQEAQKADTKSTIDWSKWKPGDAASALILKPPKAFQRLLQNQGITWKAFSDTTLTDLGNAIGEAIELGLDAKTASKRIMNHVANPARALTIAITEQNRAISQATVNRYTEAGVQKMEWITFDPCKICAQNENVEVPIGQPFPSGDTQTPAHPNCRCALIPVIPGFDDPANTAGSFITPPAPTSVNVPISETQTSQFVPGQWRELNRHEVKELFVTRAMKAMPDVTREDIENAIMYGRLKREDLDVIDSGKIIQNGPIEVMFIDTGLGVNEIYRKKLLQEIDDLQKLDPKDKMTVVVTDRGSDKAYGSAVLGDAKIWIKPYVVKDNEPLHKEVGFKMPAIATVPHRQYTLTHEWGHSRDTGGHFAAQKSVQNNETQFKILKLQKKYATDPQAFISNYARENTKEFYAEMYAEWTLTKGATTNPLVREMAETFGWNKFEISRSGPIAGITETNLARQNYRMRHQAPTRADEFGSAATDIGREMMPGFYENPKLYVSGVNPADKESAVVLMRIRNKPNEIVTIYRAVPEGVSEINPGDWVTLSRTYAEQHVASNVVNGRVISMKIPARDLWFDGNSINELGYDPVKK